MKWLTVFPLLAFTTVVYCQNTIKGRVTIDTSGTPVADGNVYFDNTSIGTHTDSNGDFEINNIPSGKYILIVSNVGFVPYKHSVDATKLPLRLSIVLKSKDVILENVLIGGFEYGTWQQWGKIFSDYFLGFNKNARRSFIKNSGGLKFKYYKQQNRLEVQASRPLLIENKLLGYTLTYELNDFYIALNSKRSYNNGYAFFQENKKSNRLKYNDLRKESYFGSMMHFLRSVYNNSIEDQGFEIFGVYQQQDSLKTRLTSDDIVVSVDGKYKNLSWGYDYIQIYYRRKKEDEAYSSMSINRDKSSSQLSVLAIKKGTTITIDQNGYWEPAQNLRIFNYWGWNQRVANMLPWDYKPD